MDEFTAGFSLDFQLVFGAVLRSFRGGVELVFGLFLLAIGVELSRVFQQLLQVVLRAVLCVKREVLSLKLGCFGGGFCFWLLLLKKMKLR